MLALALHLPFVARYDLHFQPDFAISTLMSRAIAVEGDRPIFFWDQGYLGTYGFYLTALLFRLFGVSIALAALVSLAIWASGVWLTVTLAERLLGWRAARWTGIAAAVASPYANHYIAQPYTSYETVPVLSVLVIAGLAWGERLIALPLLGRAMLGWIGLGLLLGLGWWTTRLFFPILFAALLTVALGVRWRRVRAGRAGAAAALLLAAAVLGDGPELLYRFGDPATRDEAPPLAFAPLAQMPVNFAQAVRALPAYLNGDPGARLPEGVTFSEGVAMGTGPYAGETTVAGPLAAVLDEVVLAASLSILVAAGYTGARAWRAGNLPLLALCSSPFAVLAAIGSSAQTGGGYFEARRYSFALLLVLPLLFANAIALAESVRSAAGRAARVIGSVLLLSSAVAQARMLALPDELADYRVLTRDLMASGEHAMWMTTWNAWVVAALSGGRIDGVAPHYNRSTRVNERVAASDRLAIVLPAGTKFPDNIHLWDVPFSRGNEALRRSGRWQWLSYRRISAPH